LPHRWFGRESCQPAKLRLVRGPIACPREAEDFPFWLSVVIATTVLMVGAIGARFWILPGLLVLEEQIAVPVLDLHHAELGQPEKPVSYRLRLEQVQPVAPRQVAPVAIPAMRPELVQAEWERPAHEPYDPTEALEEAHLPFPVKTEPDPEPPPDRERELTKSPPKKSTSPPRPEARPRTTPKPKQAAEGPSRPVRELKRYQPPYPQSARRAGTEGRVVLTVQVRPDGRIGSVRVSSSSGSPVLDSAAISAVKRWKFAPELEKGKPVTASVKVPFTFALK